MKKRQPKQGRTKIAGKYVTDSYWLNLGLTNNLTQYLHTSFAGSQAALNIVSNILAPIAKTGAIPYGYSDTLDNMLKATVIQTGTQATTNAINAQRLRATQAAGGAALPGATQGEQQIESMIEAKGQQSIAEGLQREKIAGYQQGLANVEAVTKGELGIAGTEAQQAGTFGGEALKGAEESANIGQEIWQENQAGNWYNVLSTTLGDISKGATAFTGVLGAASAAGAAGSGGGGGK